MPAGTKRADGRWGQRLLREIARKAVEVERLFDRRAGQPLVTVVVRCPWLADGDVLVKVDSRPGSLVSESQ